MTRYLGGLITADETKTIPADNFQDTSASGIWTLSEAEMLNKQSLWPTAGNENTSKHIENIFSIDVYTGASGSLTVTNNVNLTGEGGLVWHKGRDIAEYHNLFDTERGNGMILRTSTTNGSDGAFFGQAFTSTGWSLNTSDNQINSSSNDYVAWTFRKAPKFFDMVKYTGNGTAGRTISHNLGAVPGFMIVKRIDANGEPWYCYHRGPGATKYLKLNTTDNVTTSDEPWYNTEPTSTEVTVAQYNSVNGSGAEYILYLFGHDTTSDGMIQCGTYNGSGGDANITLGFEPQWIMIKRSVGGAAGWIMFDNIRGLTTAKDAGLFADAVNAEDSQDDVLEPTSTGFKVKGSWYFSNAAGSSYVYVAIRRGPMKTPTTRASVFAVEALSGASGARDYTTNFPVDMIMNPNTTGGSDNIPVVPRLMGQTETSGNYLRTNNDTARTTFGPTTYGWGMDYNNKWVSNDIWTPNQYGYSWRRAPGFFDVVTYTGNSTAGRTINHNLGAVPDMIWIKMRSSSDAAIAYTRGWVVTSLHLPNATATNDTTVYLNTNAAEVDEAIMNDTGPTSTVFSVSSDPFVNFLNSTYVAFLFATLAGISKVGTFSHTNGSSTDVDCGFSSGSSLVIVKRTDSTGDWYLWDSARGIVSGNDPYFLMNTQDAEVTNTDFIDPLSSGFQIASGFTTGSYFFYAIAQ